MASSRFVFVGWGILLLLFGSCSKDRDCVAGEGAARSEVRIYESDFTHINLRIAAEILLTVDSSFTFNEVRLSAQDNILDQICTPVVNGIMTIDFQSCIKQHSDIGLELRIRDLSHLELTGVGDVSGASLISLDTLDISINGSGEVRLLLKTTELNTSIQGAGNVYLDGDCSRHNFSINGGGDVHGFEFVTDSTIGSIQTTGRARVHTNVFLEGNLNGIGDLLYRGEPATIQRYGTGSGEILDDNI